MAHSTGGSSTAREPRVQLINPVAHGVPVAYQTDGLCGRVARENPDFVYFKRGRNTKAPTFRVGGVIGQIPNIVFAIVGDPQHPASTVFFIVTKHVSWAIAKID